MIPEASSWTVLAPSITPGPSLEEEVDASDRDLMLKSMTLSMALAAKEICWADRTKWKFDPIVDIATGWTRWSLLLLHHRKGEGNGISPLHGSARQHLWCWTVASRPGLKISGADKTARLLVINLEGTASNTQFLFVSWTISLYMFSCPSHTIPVRESPTVYGNAMKQVEDAACM